MEHVGAFVFSFLAHPKESSPNPLYYWMYYQNPPSILQWLSTDSEGKKKKKHCIDWMNEMQVPAKAQHFLVWAVKKRNPFNLLCMLCWNPVKTDMTANLAVSSNAFMTKAVPQDRFLGTFCHFCNSPGLPWCRWGEEASGEPWLCNALYPLKTAQN